MDFNNVLNILLEEKQEVKIVDTKTGHEIFFVKRAFKSAADLADEYIKRNRGDSLKIYYLTNKPKPFPRWELVKTIKGN